VVLLNNYLHFSFLHKNKNPHSFRGFTLYVLICVLWALHYCIIIYIFVIFFSSLFSCPLFFLCFSFCNFLSSFLISCGLWHYDHVPSYHCHHSWASSLMFVFLFITLVYYVTCLLIHFPVHHNSYSCSCLSTYSTFLFILLFSPLLICILLSNYHILLLEVFL
jgi:hypothetical protein